MSGKTLSNGTLSLRFMQNAQRAKSRAQVEAEQAKINDDAEWSVSQEVRDAWGIADSFSAQDDVVHESSYLPFIFQSEVGEGSSSGAQADGKPKLRGRRTFNARGKEVVTKEEMDNDKESKEGQRQEEENEEGAVSDSEPDKKPPRRLERLPKSISGFKIPTSARKDGKKPRTKTAQMLVHEDVSVRAPSSSMQSLEAVPIPQNAGFVKPAGVDDSSLLPRRMTADGRKHQRVHDHGADRPEMEGTKRRKRKDTSSGS